MSHVQVGKYANKAGKQGGEVTTVCGWDARTIKDTQQAILLSEKLYDVLERH
jgi:hypothetical protein